MQLFLNFLSTKIIILFIVEKFEVISYIVTNDIINNYYVSYDLFMVYKCFFKQIYRVGKSDCIFQKIFQEQEYNQQLHYKKQKKKTIYERFLKQLVFGTSPNSHFNTKQNFFLSKFIFSSNLLVTPSFNINAIFKNSTYYKIFAIFFNHFFFILFSEEIECNEITQYFDLLQALQNKDIEDLPPGGGLQSK